jgi:hypothetical protein
MFQPPELRRIMFFKVKFDLAHSLVRTFVSSKNFLKEFFVVSHNSEKENMIG